MAVSHSVVLCLALCLLSNLLGVSLAAPSGYGEKEADMLLSRQSGQCSSLTSFCNDFINSCMSACVDTHVLSRASKRSVWERTPATYKCDTTGLNSYEFGCTCNGADITGTILDTVASPPPPIATATVTRTVTETDAVATTVIHTGTTTVRSTSLGTVTVGRTTVRTSVTAASFVTTVVATSFLTLTRAATVTTSSVTLATLVGGVPVKRGVERRAAGDLFCSTYLSSCTSLCGTVRSSQCSTTTADLYTLSCVCSNNQDKTAAALYPVDKICSDSSSTATTTTTATITHDVTQSVSTLVTRTVIVPATTTVRTTVVVTGTRVVPETASITVVALTTSFVPYTTLHVFSLTGLILVGGTNHGYVSSTLEPPDGGLGDTKLPANGITVVLAEASSDGSVYIYPIDGPKTHPFIGGTFNSTTGPYSLTSTSGFIAISLVDYAPRGPATVIGSSWNDVWGHPYPSEAVVFKFDPVSFALTPFWVQADGSTFYGNGHLDVTGYNELNEDDLPSTFGNINATFTFIPTQG